MDTSSREADYVIIGAGAMGMAFADTLLTETDATMIIVDRRGRPGGHWTDAYPYVRLHQPSAFYGVNSKSLGDDTKDQVGWNKGLYELASAAQVCAYFEHVMQRRFLPSHRVAYLPLCHHLGAGRVRSMSQGEERNLVARKRLVDATYMKVTVPSMRAPPYAVFEGGKCVPLNALGNPLETPSEYVIVGAGKSGMDACLWLLANAVDPDRIRWIVPRDSWLLDRAKIQFVGDLYHGNVIDRAAQMEAAATAASIDELFAALEQCGQLMRIDEAATPTMYRCATVTRAELAQLRRIKNVVRLGRVQRIEHDAIVLERGTVPTTPDALYVDCSADGLPMRPAVPIFDGDSLGLQTVRTCQQAFSAAFIAHVEGMAIDDRAKNDICRVVPHPDTDQDWLRVTRDSMANQMRWMRDEGLREWLHNSRLDGFSRPTAVDATASSAFHAARKRTSELVPRALGNLDRLLGT